MLPDPSRHPRRSPSLWLGVLLAVILLNPTLALPQAPAPPPTTIRGTVLNSVTREPIARALVTSQDDRCAALTDDQGRFSFTIPPRAPAASGQGQTGSFIIGPDTAHTFHARKPGYLDDEGSNLSSLNAGDQELVFTLTPESLIIGRVALPSAGSFDRISVELYRRQVADGRPRWNSAGAIQARSNGEFRFAGLPAGTYKIFTSELLDRDPLTIDPNGQQFGYPPTYYPTASDFSAAAPIALAAGQTFQAELTPTLHPYYPVKITIPNTQPGDPINVTVAPAGHYGPGFSLGFNSESSSIEGMLPSGTYTIEAIRYGNQVASGLMSLTVRNAPARTATLLLLPSRTIPINVKEEFTAVTENSGGGAGMNYVAPGNRLRRGPAAALSVVGASLLPADDFSPQPGSGLAPMAPGDPSLRIANSIPGRYWVQVNATRGYIASATSAGVDLLLNPLVVAPGGASAPIDITLRDDTAEISGTIEGASTDKARLPQAPAVYCLPLPDSPGTLQQAALQLQPGEAPTFHCSNLSPGSYRVLAFDHQQPQLEFRSLDAMRPYESKGPVVRLVGGQKEDVRVPLNHE